LRAAERWLAPNLGYEPQEARGAVEGDALSGREVGVRAAATNE